MNHYHGNAICQRCNKLVPLELLEPVEPEGKAVCEDCWDALGRPDRWNPTLPPTIEAPAD